MPARESGVTTTHCTQHREYVDGCPWCRSAVIGMRAATRRFECVCETENHTPGNCPREGR